MRPTRPIRPCRPAAAPATYWASAGPRLGACVDAEANGQPTVGALGDDNATGSPTFGDCSNPDDEDGVTNGLSGLVEGVPSSLTIAVSNATCPLNAWIDFNGDGDWNDAGEQIASNAAMAVGPQYATGHAAGSFDAGDDVHTLRCNTAGGLGPTGGAADGEVEDYAAQHPGRFRGQRLGRRAGHRAGTGTGNYQTVGTDNGAHHVLNANVFLGACVDSEANGQQSGGATGDDTNGRLPPSSLPWECSARTTRTGWPSRRSSPARPPARRHHECAQWLSSQRLDRLQRRR